MSLFPSLQRPLAIILAGSMLLSHVPVYAEEDLYKIPDPSPSDFDDIQDVVESEIPSNLEEAQCGGWDMFQSVVGGLGAGAPIAGAPAFLGPPGYIQFVEGAPGRYGEPLENLESGMAKRVEVGGVEDLFFDPQSTLQTPAGTNTGLQYPADVCGFTTMCRPKNSFRYRGQQVQPKLNSLLFPRFMCRHPCERPLGGEEDPGREPGCPIQPDVAFDEEPEVDCRNTTCDDPDDLDGDGNKECRANPNTEIRYSCGCGRMQGPEDSPTLCEELLSEGLKGGLADHLNRMWKEFIFERPFLQVVSNTDEDGNTTSDVEEVGTYYLKGRCGNPLSEYSQKEKDDREESGWSVAGEVHCCTFSGKKDPSFGPDPDVSDPGTAPIVQLSDPGTPILPSEPNAKTCTGDNCRYQPPIDNGLGFPFWIVRNANGIKRGISNLWPVEFEPRQYVSYFRHYPEPKYERAELTTASSDSGDIDLVPDDDAKREKIPISCYNMYLELDAKKRRIFSEDKSCVIAASYPSIKYDEMKETQLGKGHYGEDSNFPDPDFGIETERLPDAPLWDDELSGTFSLIEPKLFDEDLNKDISFALLAPDTAQTFPTVQLTPIQPLSSGAFLRAFDDTVTNDTLQEDLANATGSQDPELVEEPDRTDRRTIVEWWQEVEIDMHKRLTPSVVRLLLPAPFTADLRIDDAFFSSEIPDIAQQPDEDETDPHLDSIEEQLDAKEDLVGDLAGFFARMMLLRFEQEEIVIVVPAGSPTEFRVYAQGWQSWIDYRTEVGLSVGSEAQALVVRLEEYAVRIEQMRALQAALPSYLALLLERQRKVTETIAVWLDRNVDRYQQYLTQREQDLQLVPLWERVQEEYRALHEDKNFRWCRNDRFTTSIYSLLDSWMPGSQIIVNASEINLNPDREITAGIFDTARTDGGGRIPFFEKLPRLEEIEDQNDVHLDMSFLQPPLEPILLPVLKPVQIRVNNRLIDPPDLLGTEPDEYPELPELPEPEDSPFLDFASTDPDDNPFAALLPKIITEDPPAIADIEGYPAPRSPGDDQDRLTNIFIVLILMKREYDNFWESILIEKPAGEEQDCLNANEDTCVHYEHDLIERLTRIGARPAVFLREDFFSVAPERGRPRDPTEDTVRECDRKDWVCHALNELKVRTGEGWAFTGSSLNQEDAIDDLKRDIFELTLPIGGLNEDIFPFFTDSNEITPTFNEIQTEFILPDIRDNPNIDR